MQFSKFEIDMLLIMKIYTTYLLSWYTVEEATFASEEASKGGVKATAVANSVV